MYAPVLCISTSFWVLRAPKSWSNYFFQLFSTFFVHFRKSSLNSLHEPKSTCTHFEKYISIHIACNIFNPLFTPPNNSFYFCLFGAYQIYCSTDKNNI